MLNSLNEIPQNSVSFRVKKVYGLLQAFFIEGDPHSYTQHIERVDREERDIVLSA